MVESSLGGSSRARLGWVSVVALALSALLLAAVFASRADARFEAFQGLAPSSVELTSVGTDPATGLIYAQENGGTAFFRYDPHTNGWSDLAEAPLDSGNNGGAAFLNGKVYTVYSNNDEKLGVYDVASNSWTTIDNPLADGTSVITATGGKLYLIIGKEFVALDPATGGTTPLAGPPPFTPAINEGNCEAGFEAWGGLQPVEGKIYGHQGNGCVGFAVYDIATNSWNELPPAPKVIAPYPDAEPEGPVLGSAYDPLTNTYLTYGSYSGKSLFRYDIEAGTWSTSEMPFLVDDGGMAYVSQSGIEGVYMIQGEEGTEFTRYTERNVTDLAPKATAKVKKGGKITVSVVVSNLGPERAGGVVLSNPLPKGAKLISATPSQGTCSATPTLSCSLGALPSGIGATVKIKVKTRSKKLVTTATVSSLALDANAASDAAKLETKQCVVPKVKSRSVKAAKKALRKANCKPGKVTFRFSGNTDEGKVIRGSKSRGKLLPKGSRVKLVVSEGPKPTK